MFAEGPHRNLPLSTKRAILIHNNPDLLDCLDTNRVPANMMVDITPLRLSKFDKIFWQGERSLYQNYLESFDGRTRDMFQQTGPEESYLLTEMVQTLAEAGAAVGVDGLVTSAASGAAAAGQLSLVRINSLARLIYEDAARQFGRKAAASLTKANLAKLGTFIKAHPSYPALMREMEQVPRFLLPMSRANLLPPAAANVNSAAFSHYFVKQHFQAFRRWPSGKYMGSIARQLNGRINLFRAAGRYATWYVPAVIGLYNVYDASPGMRVKTVFEEGFGIVGGYLGTWLGSTMVASGVIGLFALCGLCLGPFGIFLTVLICASTGGVLGNLLFKKGATELYKWSEHFDLTRIYQSPEQLIEAFQ